MSICHSRKGGGGCREQASVDSGSTLWVSRIVAHNLYFLHNMHFGSPTLRVAHFVLFTQYLQLTHFESFA